MSNTDDRVKSAGPYSARAYCAVAALCIVVAALPSIQKAVLVHIAGDMLSDWSRDPASWHPMAASLFMSTMVDLLLYGGLAALLVTTGRLPLRTAAAFAVAVTVLNQLVLSAIGPLVSLASGAGNYSDDLSDAVVLLANASGPLFILALGAVTGAFARPRNLTVLTGFVFAAIVLLPYVLPSFFAMLAELHPRVLNVLGAVGLFTYGMNTLRSLVSAGLCLALFAPMRDGRLREHARTG